VKSNNTFLDPGSVTVRAQGFERVLAGYGPGHHPASMFVVSEAEAAAIRTTFQQEGEFSAVVELRRLFPLIADMAEAGSAPGPSPAGSRCPRRRGRSGDCDPGTAVPDCGASRLAIFGEVATLPVVLALRS
jgi:hypothetical protein